MPSSSLPLEPVADNACPRCRPPHLSASAPWSTRELVCRATRSIVRGALDGRTEDELGHELGVSPRHLRRLFTGFFGLTPDGLARWVRTQRARRLLADSDLNVLQVALDSGFGSVRHLNRVCRESHRASPTELRRRLRSAPAGDDEALLLRLWHTGPLDWPAHVAFLGAHVIPGVERVVGETYRRAIAAGDQPGVLQLSRGGDDHLLVRLQLQEWDDLFHVVDGARRVANLDLDLDEAIADLGRDPTLAPLVAARPGIRPPGAWDPFEAGVRAVIGQRFSSQHAGRIAARLVERHGRPALGLHGLGLTRLFPAPGDLADADLDALGLPPAASTAIRSFAQAVAAGSIRLDRTVELATLISSFAAARALGEWPGQYVALRLGEPDACPIPDVHGRRSVTRGVTRGLGLRAGELRAQVDRWRPWRAVATTHLWIASASTQGAARLSSQAGM